MSSLYLPIIFLFISLLKHGPLARWTFDLFLYRPRNLAFKLCALPFEVGLGLATIVAEVLGSLQPHGSDALVRRSGGRAWGGFATGILLDTGRSRCGDLGGYFAVVEYVGAVCGASDSRLDGLGQALLGWIVAMAELLDPQLEIFVHVGRLDIDLDQRAGVLLAHRVRILSKTEACLVLFSRLMAHSSRQS